MTNDNANPISVTGSLSSNPACPAENVQHWYNVFFTPGGSVALFLHDTNPSLINELKMVQIPLDSSAVNAPLDMRQLTADRLNDLGYFVDDGSIRPITFSDLDNAGVNTISTICAEN